MACQNIPGFNSIKLLLVTLCLLLISRVSAVHLREDKYLRSCQPEKLKFVKWNGDFRLNRQRRDVASSDKSPPPLNVTDVYLEGTKDHREAYMHWSGKKSNVIFILTRQRGSTGDVVHSKLWKSVDYGSTYTSITFPDALISFFYVSPPQTNQLIFVDAKNKKLYITKDDLKTNYTAALPFSPDRIMPHPHVADYILGYSFEQRKVYVSKDFGHTWTLFHSGVTPRIFWGDDKYDSNETVHLEVLTSRGNAQYKRCNITADCQTVKFDASVGEFDTFTMLVLNEYVFVQKSSRHGSIMYVSHKRKAFVRAYFPPVTNTRDFMIVNADEGQVFIAVNHVSTANLYLSDSTGQFYILTLADVAFFTQTGWFDIDMYEVQGVRGTYIANYRENQSLFKSKISFNKGGEWKDIPTPENKLCNTSDCSLHLAIHNGYGGQGILSEKKAPGLLLAHGNVGSSLKLGDMLVFISRDGGWSWSKTPLKSGRYKFNILDQGSVMTAIVDASFNATDSVHYTTNEGKTWKSHKFLTNKEVRVDGVLNEPGITTLIASVYGHESKDSVWAVIKLDFSSILTRKCAQADYETWQPSDKIANDKCLLGEKLTYERRKQLSFCYNGNDYERPINSTSCTCEEEDFECSYGFDQSGDHDCKQASWFDNNSILHECPEGQIFNKSKGYRKVASDKCHGGVSTHSKYLPTKTKCPTVAPGQLEIIPKQGIAATKSSIEFTLFQGTGSKTSTVYTWTFNDSSQPEKKTGFENSTVTHTFANYGTYLISVTASNSKGSVTSTLQFRVEDKITETVGSFPWATKVGHLTDFNIDVDGPSVTNNTAHIHFLWTFGDEGQTRRPVLTWDRRVEHMFNKSGNFTVTVEAINSVSTVYKQYTIQVFEQGVIVRLGFSENVKRFDFEHTVYLKSMFRGLLEQVLLNSLGVSARRIALHIHSTTPLQVDVQVLEPNSKEESSADTVVSQLLNATKAQSLLVAMDGRKDPVHIVRVVSAEIINDDVPNIPKNEANLKAVYIAVPILVGAALVTILVLLYYRKKFREGRRYSLLRQRCDDDALLGGDEEDDPPLDLNPEFGTSDQADDDDHLDLGTGSHLVMIAGRDMGDHSVNC